MSPCIRLRLANVSDELSDATYVWNNVEARLHQNKWVRAMRRQSLHSNVRYPCPFYDSLIVLRQLSYVWDNFDDRKHVRETVPADYFALDAAHGIAQCFNARSYLAGKPLAAPFSDSVGLLPSPSILLFGRGELCWVAKEK